MSEPGKTPSGPFEDLYPGTLDCVHCGLCLPVCPTYRITGRETSSPRGRVYLMRGVAEGRIPLAETVAEEAYLCLGCRACETACPSGVRFGALVEQTRAVVDEAGLRDGWRLRVERFLLRRIVPHPGRLHALVSGLGLVQRARLDRLALPMLPRALRDAHALMPRIPPADARGRLPALTPARGPRRGRVALLEGCIMPELFGRVNAATVRVLAQSGFDVLVPRGQGCCGALHAHAGDPETARALVAENVVAFAGEEVDAVITNSAGCGAALRECGELLPGRAESLAARARDVCAFLDEVGLRGEPAALRGTVCYDDPCHLLHGQGVEAAPRRLLEQIPGLELIAHRNASGCCGAAGIYNLTHGEMSREVLARKMDSLAEAGPDWIATGNPGCLMQIESGARARGLAARVVHPVELLDLALGPQEPGATRQ